MKQYQTSEYSGIFIEAEGFGCSVILSASPLNQFYIIAGASIQDW
ncbi:MAG: hypothetical protein QGH37_20045 [Candidatus Poribacteria bacterium]|nr:hypothetical protein [Candidatus Poribacteria bacterium]MDP6962168.1 hypothetical protein [Dehalococcoidia bacterium]